MHFNFDKHQLTNENYYDIIIYYFTCEDYNYLYIHTIVINNFEYRFHKMSTGHNNIVLWKFTM